MDTWQFYQNDGGEWCWKHIAVTRITTHSERCYVSRTDCIADAMRNGYLARPNLRSVEPPSLRDVMPWR